MSLPALAIRRPVTILMVFTGVILFGIISTGFLRQELFPPIIYPKLTVVTNYANAAPEEIETLITKPIEEAVGGTNGIRTVTSISKEGISLVIAEFGWSQNMDFAALGVREKIDLIKARLPRDAEEPTVIKFNPFELPVVTLSVSSDKRTPVQLKRFATKWIKDEIEKINGVASASISGGADEEILVEVDQGRLKASNLGILDISKAISEANLNYPGGTIKENFYEYLVRTIGEFQKIDEINKIAVGKEETEVDRFTGEDRTPSHKLVLLNDVAEVKRVTKERTSYSRYNDRENLTISVQKQAQANTIQIAAHVLKRLDELKAQMPEDIQVDLIYNQATFIKQAIEGVRDAGIQGGVLAFIILLIFLRNLRSSILVIFIIPVTILATLTLMYFMGISLNVISLGGVALGVGMLIDSAIVVIENVYRHFNSAKGLDIRKCAVRGTEEVVAPLMASTLTTVMVFLPMIFVKGIAGQIFKELAWVVVVTQLFSIVVAFTFLPMLIVQFDRFRVKNAAKGKEDNPEDSKLNRVLNIAGKPIAFVEKIYHFVLPAFLKRKGLYLIGVFGLFIFSIFMMTKYDAIAMPKVDQGQFMIKVDLPVGSRLERTNEIALGIERYLGGFKDIKSVSTVVGSSKGDSQKQEVQQIGSHQSQLLVTLNKERKIHTNELVQQIREGFRDVEMRKILKNASISFVMYESTFSAGSDQSAPIVINITGNSLDVMAAIAHKLEEGLSDIQGVFDISNTIPESAPETKIIVNKDQAAFYRLSVTDLATAAHISIKGTVASKFKEDGKEIDIRVILKKAHIQAISELPFIQMHSPLGLTVPLSEVVSFRSGKGPSEIKRVGQERTIQVFAKVFERSLSEVTGEVQKVIDDANVPVGYFADIAGESAEVKESFDSLKLALILSIVLVYMIMAAQFESYFQPFIIMFTVPLSIIGVSAGLGLTGTAISVVVILGVILLGGIVVNNGIILVDFINHKVELGTPVRKALIEAGQVRFRPIMMTAMTTILGLLPLAMGIGEGSKLQAPMAIAVMGGLTAATFLTLVVIPAIYEISQGIRNRFSKKKKKDSLVEAKS